MTPTTSARWRRLSNANLSELRAIVHSLPWTTAKAELDFVMYVNELRNAMLLYEAAAQSALDVVKSSRGRGTLLTALGLDPLYSLRSGRYANEARAARERVVRKIVEEAHRAGWPLGIRS
jgi:hypothetical protein